MKFIYYPFSILLSLCFACGNTDQQKKDNLDSNAHTEENTTENQADAGQEVPYVLAQHYFVKNTVAEDKNGAFKIESQAAFDELFAAATSMGNNGMPTIIDFNKQFVIAIISPSSDLAPQIDQISLKKLADGLHLNYKETLGEKQSFTMRPVALLIVDKQFDGPLKSEILQEI